VKYVAVAMLLCSTARADNTGNIANDTISLEIDHCTPDTVSKEELLKRGADYYQRGEVLYLQGDYHGAVVELVHSYCEVPFYSILKDIGQAYERDLEYGRAIAYFSRYIVDIPADAKRSGTCAVDPQEDKQNVLARIQVLERLPAKIRVQATPSDAQVTVVQSSVVKARGSSGDELAVPGGPYQLVISRDGYHEVSRDIHPDIGKPYTYFETLSPIKGRLHIRTVPGDARIFLDNRNVATGIYDAEMAGAKYHLSIEAPDFTTIEKDIEVVPDKDTNLSIELPHEPEFGRKQLVAYTSAAAPIVGGLVGIGTDNAGYTALAVIGGGTLGFLGVYYGTDRNLALGTSSLTVTSSLIGGVTGGALGIGLNGEDYHVYLPLIGTGLVVGGIAGYLVGDQTHLSPGDSAVINSGALWGTVAGSLFSFTFKGGDQIGAGLVATGLGMGTVGGVLLQRFFTVSRGRALLIDASGVVGVLLGLAAEQIVQSIADQGSPATTERTANYALGGVTVGLVLGGILTRSIDDPKLPTLTPSINKVRDASGGQTTTLGFAGAF
jgi:hypothetical protein